MTQEEKDIVLHGARFELMNTCINFNDGTVDREKMMNVMQKYAEMYHYNELSKLSQHDVSSSVCEHLHQKWEGIPPIRICQVCREDMTYKNYA